MNSSNRSYLLGVFCAQNACFDKTHEFTQADSEARAVLLRLEDVLYRLDGWASCVDGCHGGDHVAERLAARVVSFAAAGARLAHMGHYDEALSLIRAIGETANLFSWFRSDHEAFKRWKELGDRKRWQEFHPGKVRKQLDESQIQVWMDKARYGELCGVAVHPSPSAKPQSYDVGHPPAMGAYFQTNGMLQCLYELALQVGGFTTCLSALDCLEGSTNRDLCDASAALLSAIPGVEVGGDDGA